METSPRPALRRPGRTPEALLEDMVSNLYYSRGTTMQSASRQDAYHTVALTIRDRLVDRRARTVAAHYEANPRFVYYLSAEYMLGRQLDQNLLYTGTDDMVREVLGWVGMPLERLAELDVEPGLGNGGLGRLAACLLDSLATLDIPAVGYGIRYDFGIFKQEFVDGEQVETPDDWTFYGNPWEFPAPDDRQLVGFFGHTEENGSATGLSRRWVPGETVRGEPSHMLVPGYGTETVNIVRLWHARASRQSFDLRRFSAGQYAEAVQDAARSENISKVLYPDDSTEPGRELRLKQQYFLVSCSLRDIIRRFRFRNDDWEEFPAKVVVQLNDTHPVLAVVELMRLLVDEHQVPWKQAWSITRRTFDYTCHTLLPEALETWPVWMLHRLLPRHLEIIYLINYFHLESVALRFPGDLGKLSRLSLVQEGTEPRIRMASLAVVGSGAVNGVAQLHSDLLARTTLHDFAEMWPERFHNVTNGVSPRRFLRLANPRLSALITAQLGDEGWLRDLDRLKELESLAEDTEARAAWRAVKRANTRDLAEYTARTIDVSMDPDALCDVMIKRFHEYKRQVLQLLHVVTLYLRILNDPQADVVPRTVVFGGKAAPAYRAAKRIMKLINSVAGVVNADPVVAGRLTVAFLPDYNVTRTELIAPAADLSEQISMAGKEASGTGNMKLALNGALTIGTLDGANIEIREQVGAENFFLFGLDAADAAALRGGDYDPRAFYEQDDDLRAAIDAIAGGAFSGGDSKAFAEVIGSLLGRDEYLVLADYRSYLEAQDAVASAWRDQESWTRASILTTARCGYFSSDRTVRDYCSMIWRVDPVAVPGPDPA